MNTSPLAPCHIRPAGGAAFCVQPQSGQSLSQCIWLSGHIPAPALCSGIGRCGLCRVRFVALASTEQQGNASPPAALPDEYSILGNTAVEQGWRLACRHPARTGAGWVLELPPNAARFERENRMQPADLAAQESLLLAIDLGTTSLCWQALTAQGQVVAQGQQPNPQAGAGADIMHRLHQAQQPQGKAQLAWLARQAVADIIDSLPAPVAEICLAANPAMTAIFLLHDCSGLCAAPYRLGHHGNVVLSQLPIDPRVATAHNAANTILPQATKSHKKHASLPPVFVPPQLFPFIGGDVSAGLLALSQQPDVRYPFLLADMGTNGEFILALSPTDFLAASVPLGPALEGCGLTLGAVAAPHSATAFSLSPTGLLPRTPTGQKAQRISGTGYLSLISILLRIGLLDHAGHFVLKPATPLAQRLGRTVQAGCLPLTPELFLSAHDVEELLKVKAAFSLAVESLLQAAGIGSNALQKVYLAGALGAHVQPDDLITLGFLPTSLRQLIHAAGNTALQGAALLLQKPALRDTVATLAQHCRLLPVAESATFTHDYMRHMRF